MGRPKPDKIYEIPFEAGRAHDFKVEFFSDGGPAFARVHRWSIKKGRKKTVYANYYLTAADDRNAPPAVELLSPLDGAAERMPGSIVLEARASDGDGSVKLVRFYDGTRLIGTSGKLPYAVTLDRPAPGPHVFVAQAVDDHGLTAVSPAVNVTVGDDLAGKLPKPWAAATLGPVEARTKTSCVDGQLTLATVGGELHSNVDAFHGVFQPCEGDFQVLVRLTSLATDGTDARPLAGLAIRRDFGPGSAEVALVLAPDHRAIDLFRHLDGRHFVTNESAADLPAWLRLTRRGPVVSAHTSKDGKQWSLVASHPKSELPDKVIVAVVASSEDPKAVATASFEALSVTPILPEQHVPKGVLLTDGTFLTNGLISDGVMEPDEGKVSIRLHGRKQPDVLPQGQVARILYKPVAAEAIAALPEGKSGVMLSNGDLVEGAVTSGARGEVRVDSVEFGVKRFSSARDLAAVVLGSPGVGGGKYRVETKSGSKVYGKSVRAQKTTFVVEESLLGEVAVPQAEVTRIVVAKE